VRSFSVAAALTDRLGLWAGYSRSPFALLDEGRKGNFNVGGSDGEVLRIGYEQTLAARFKRLRLPGGRGDWVMVRLLWLQWVTSR
jgi:hypothetical protein